MAQILSGLAVARNSGDERTNPRTVVFVQVRQICIFQVIGMLNDRHFDMNQSQLISVVVATLVISQRFRLGERRSV